MLTSACCSGKLDNNNTRATVGGRDTVSLVKIYPSLSARDFCTLGLSSPLRASPNTQSSEEHQAWPQPGAGRAAASPGDGRPGDADKGCCLCPPSLPPSRSTSYTGSSSKGRIYLHYCLGGDEIAKSHRPSRSSPVRRRRAPEQSLPKPRPPAPPHPPPAVRVSPREHCSPPARWPALLPSVPSSDELALACLARCLRCLAESADLPFPWSRGVGDCSEE